MLQNEATAKWYRSVQIKNLTQRAEGSSRGNSGVQLFDFEAGTGNHVVPVVGAALSGDFAFVRILGGSKLGRKAVKMPMAGRNEQSW